MLNLLKDLERNGQEKFENVSFRFNSAFIPTPSLPNQENILARHLFEVIALCEVPLLHLIHPRDRDVSIEQNRHVRLHLFIYLFIYLLVS